MKINRASLATLCLCASAAGQAAATRTLDIYFIDVEGGQSTLIVTPDRQSFLIDTGWAGDGSPDAVPADPSRSRDAKRIVAAAHDAGIRQIDYLLITHFHTDHDGGVVELAQLMPILHFIDHGTLPPEAKQEAPTRNAYERYLALRNKAPHVEPSPGDHLPIPGIDVTVVASATATLSKPLPGAGKDNPVCGPAAVPPRDLTENPRSTGVVITFGRFRFLDVGDLSGQPLFNLACPKSLIGPVDAYLVAHHGGPDVGDPATFAAFEPRIAIMNNGLKKGGAKTTYESLHHVAGLEDVWQIHRSEAADEENYPTAQIANIDETTAAWLKLTATEDGAFRVVNGRTGTSKVYPARR